MKNISIITDVSFCFLSVRWCNCSLSNQITNFIIDTRRQFDIFVNFFKEMGIMDISKQLAKTRGSMLGVLVGDCCGGPYEGEPPIESGDWLVLRKYFDTLEGPMFKAPKKAYSDDSIMTQAVAETLLNHRTIDPNDLANNFVQQYFKDPRRGYGGAIIDFFHKFRRDTGRNPVELAKEQFSGSGSFGNGGAMRVAPVALFYSGKSLNEVTDLARKSAEVTHAHRDGINGTILQAIAIHTAFHSNADIETDPEKFLAPLKIEMEIVESMDAGKYPDNPSPYGQRLRQISRLLAKSHPSSYEEVINVLGNKVSALQSVPTSIYCFLRSFKEIPNIETTNPFRRSIEYAISLGGDTDTIASMTGAIAGAYHGDSLIPENLVKHCESYETFLMLADQLAEAGSKQN